MGGFHAGGSTQKTTNNQNQSVDTNTRQQLGAIQSHYDQAGQAGPGPLLNGAAGYGTAAQTAGQTGLSALSGDPKAAQSLMNPYIQNVIDANNANAAKTAQQGTNQLNSQATAAGAFGGSRQGVAEGAMLANNQLNNNTINANLLNSGYNSAMQQAQSLAGFGGQGAALNSNLGFGGVGNPSLWYAQQLKNGFIQPTGGTSGGAQTTTAGSVGWG